MRKANFRYLTIAILAALILIASACPKGSSSGPADPNATAATVNGTAITMEQVERGVKQQAQGQEGKFSPLEIARARLQVLEGLIQQEVMYQEAESEGAIPTEEEVTAELNKVKNASGESKEALEKRMKEAGETEESVRESFKRQLAIKKLTDKVTGVVEQPSDAEIEASFAGNPEAFVKRRGVKMAAIIVDPRNSGEGDTTIDEASSTLKIQEIGQQLSQGADFATVARAHSEDQSRNNGGDLSFLTEDQMKQQFPPQLAEYFMDAGKVPLGRYVGPFSIAGRFYIFKLQERVVKEETLTLESPGIRQSIADSLVNSRKQLLSSSYGAIAMSEAKVRNFLAQKIVDNPNELSGARPANAEVSPEAKASPADANSEGDKKASDEKAADDPKKTAVPAATADAKESKAGEKPDATTKAATN